MNTKLIFIALLFAIGLAVSKMKAQTVTNRITLSVPTDGSITELKILPAISQHTNHPPFPPQLPLSVQMRVAAQEARGKAAPWCQRFIVVKVTDEARTREDGSYSTNYTVTLAPVTDETNTPVSWGATKAKTFRLETTRPTKKGDEFDFYPVATNEVSK